MKNIIQELNANKSGIQMNPDFGCPEGKFLVKKVMSLEGVWYEVDCKVTDSSYQTPSKLITFLTKNSPSVFGFPLHF